MAGRGYEGERGRRYGDAAQRVKAFVSKPNNVCTTFRTYRKVGEENR